MCLRGVRFGIAHRHGRGVCEGVCAVCLRLGQSSAGRSSAGEAGWWERVGSPLLPGRLTFHLETPSNLRSLMFVTAHCVICPILPWVFLVALAFRRPLNIFELEAPTPWQGAEVREPVLV